MPRGGLRAAAAVSVGRQNEIVVSLRAPALTVYFDTNVLDPIANQAAGGRVKSLLKRHQAVAFGSIQNLIELFRIEVDEDRALRIRTLLQVARNRETDPFLYQDIHALVKQIGAHHPDWIDPSPELATIRKERNDAKKAWEKLKGDPHHRPPGFLRSHGRLRSLVGESLRRQRTRESMPVPGRLLSEAVSDQGLDARMKPLFGALPVPEAHWREDFGLAYWSAVGDCDPTMTNVRDWLRPHLLPDRIDLESWIRFWIAELDGAAVPRMRVEGFTDYFQVKVDAGNAGDIEHSGYAVGSDYLLTADKGFYGVLLKVRAQLGTTMAQPRLIDRAATNIVEEITRALGWNA
jgi:hypothetical protein